MDRITVNDLRHAVMYVANQSGKINLQNVSNEDLLKLDFVNDLKFGNIRLINVATELKHMLNIDFPAEVLRTRTDDTVGAFLNTLNNYLDKETDN